MKKKINSTPFLVIISFLYLTTYQNVIPQLSPKIVVIDQHYTEGLFSSFINVLNNLQSCEENNTIPVVFWDSSSLYHTDGGFNGAKNVWEYYFEPVSDIQWESALNIQDEDEIGKFLPNKIPPPGFNYYAISQKIRNSAYSLISKYIRIKPIINNKINNFYQNNMLGKNTIGIHLRGTDRNRKVTPQEIVSKARAYANTTTQFLIATDEQKLLEELKILLEGFTVVYYNCCRSKNETPLHCGPKLDNDRPSRAQLGEDVLIEAMLLAKCNLLIHNLSSVSTAALYFNPKLENIRLVEETQEASVAYFSRES